MNQKALLGIIVILLVVVLAGAGAFITLDKSAPPTSLFRPTPTPQAPAPGQITINGEITCLPKTGSAEQTLECAVGLKDFNNRYYGLKNLSDHDPGHTFSSPGISVQVTGTFIPEELSGPGGAKYDVVGTIDISSIKIVSNGDTRSGTSAIQPDDPQRSGLASYPDLSLSSLPNQPASVKFIVEHRSALNGKTILIRGVIVGALLGEEACPPDRGMCAQPSLFLADSAGENRNKLYDLRVLVGEEEQEKSYPIGKTIDLQVIIDGSKTAVNARKTY